MVDAGIEAAEEGKRSNMATGDPIRDRRTFAIISHPDAGKTTLTENLLLLGGAIRMAGQVRAKGERRRTQSDWMKIEQDRGISVTTAVMTFQYEDIIFNLLDTPGHEDFSEDTYRTLTAADSAIMVIDAAKGIEAQTLKLFEVCRLRDIPIITFINKMDREAREHFELIDEIADKLALDVSPVMWPCGSGTDFKGAQDLTQDVFYPYASDGEESEFQTRLDGNSIQEHLSAEEYETLCTEIELVEDGYPEFDLSSYLSGHLTPVFFGSALKKFAVQTLLDGVARWAPSPRPQSTQSGSIEPTSAKVSGFVFKVQANMDPNHRDRVAFMRMVSGQFKRGMRLHQSSTGKQIGIHNPILFFAQDRELVEEAWPGDVIGIPNHGTIRVGDTLSESSDIVFTGIPNFAPEILRRVRLMDPMKSKHMRKALESLAEEGVTQVFKPMIGANWIVGVVGQLQLDVLKTRVSQEYNLDIDFEAAPFEMARWISGPSDVDLKKFVDSNKGSMAEDRDGSPVFLAASAWELNYTQEKWPDIVFLRTKERA